MDGSPRTSHEGPPHLLEFSSSTLEQTSAQKNEELASIDTGRSSACIKYIQCTMPTDHLILLTAWSLRSSALKRHFYFQLVRVDLLTYLGRFSNLRDNFHRITSRRSTGPYPTDTAVYACDFVYSGSLTSPFWISSLTTGSCVLLVTPLVALGILTTAYQYRCKGGGR